jgi:hypothetical protein
VVFGWILLLEANTLLFVVELSEGNFRHIPMFCHLDGRFVRNQHPWKALVLSLTTRFVRCGRREVC